MTFHEQHAMTAKTPDPLALSRRELILLGASVLATAKSRLIVTVVWPVPAGRGTACVTACDPVRITPPSGVGRARFQVVSHLVFHIFP